jgi:hypothetical protein
MSKQFYRENHYVPQAYLRRWAHLGDKVWTSRLLVSHANVPIWKESSIKGVAKRRDFYTRIITSGETDDIERWLNDSFEMPAQEAIEKATSGQRLSPQDRRHLILFLAAQDVRTPARLLESMKRWESTLDSIVQETLEESVREFVDAKRDGRELDLTQHPETNYFPIKVSKEFVPNANEGYIRVDGIAGRGLWLFSLRHLLNKTATVLLKHKWTILCCPPGMTWITSDDPVVKLNYRRSGDYDFGGGWGTRGTEIFLPLGPRHLLYTKIGSRPPRRGTVLSPKIAEAFQRFCVEHAHRLIFSTTPNPQVEIWRPRHINGEHYAHEEGQWANWHVEQTEAERSLLNRENLA